MDNELDKYIFSDSTHNLMNEFKVNHKLQRLDSTRFNSNLKRLSRLGVMSATMERFLKGLMKVYDEAFVTIDPTLKERYLGKDERGYDYFGHVRPSDRDRAMLTVANDIFTLINQFDSNPLVVSTRSFALLNRVFNDQCRVNHEDKFEADSEIVMKGNDEVESTSFKHADIDLSAESVEVVDASDMVTESKVELLPAKEISSGSLQNPSDPDAAYSGHKGQGYHVQLVETYTPINPESDERPLNLITLVKVEKANEPDSDALKPIVDELVERDLKPEVLATDTLYGSDENSEYAASKNIDLLSPTSGNGGGCSRKKGSDKLTSKEKTIDNAQTVSFASENTAWPETHDDEPDEFVLSAVKLSDFVSTKRGVVTGCPMGQTAKSQRNKDNKGGRAYFDRKVCLRCPLCGHCPVTITKNKAWLSYQDEQVRLDKRRAYQETNEFKDRYRWRSGIEATNSQLARIGAKRLRVRGGKRSRFKMNFKALALNAKRVIRYVSQKSK
jgi:hypothetical protein